MKTKVKKNKINFKGKMVNIGTDMHKRSWRITALVEGDIVMSIALARPKYDSMRKILSHFEGNYVRIVYEAGPGGFDLYDRLTADGIECIVTPPSLIPSESGKVINCLNSLRAICSRRCGSSLLKKGLTGNWSGHVGRSSTMVQT